MHGETMKFTNAVNLTHLCNKCVKDSNITKHVTKQMEKLHN